ncbi:hypothetical protein ACFS07_23575 [Undibacterium arcticum]
MTAAGGHSAVSGFWFAVGIPLQECNRRPFIATWVSMTSLNALAVAMLCAGVAPSVLCAPHVPASDAEVIEHLPRRTDPAQQEFLALRSRLAAAPDDMPLALTLARRYIGQSRVEGDPRYLGYAQAALAPWYDKLDPPTEVRVLRATLLQSTHQFPASLRDLDAVVKADPRNAQAWLTRATVLQVMGDYARATQSCNELRSLAPALITITCLSNVASLNGQARQSYERLKSALTKAPDVDPGIRIWVTTLLAEMAERLGEFPAAEEYFKTALAVDDADSYLLGAYADFSTGPTARSRSRPTAKRQDARRCAAAALCARLAGDRQPRRRRTGGAAQVPLRRGHAARRHRASARTVAL